MLVLQVDGFRFDIMGHHFVTNMNAIRNALNQLTLERDGVDGRHIYIYGEAWDFGEVALNQRGRNASQHNLVRHKHTPPLVEGLSKPLAWPDGVSLWQPTHCLHALRCGHTGSC